MQITLYRRSYPVKDAPVSLSLLPFSVDQRHTYTVGKKVYESETSELHVIVPEESKIDPLKNLLAWQSDKGWVKSTATEVLGFAEAKVSGFRTVK